MKRLIAVSAVVGALALASLPGRALASGSFATTIPVQATVISGCIFGGNTLNFGVIDPISSAFATGITTTGFLELSCATTPSVVTIDIDSGANGAVAPLINSTRAMTNGTSFLGYDVYKPSVLANTAVPPTYTCPAGNVSNGLWLIGSADWSTVPAAATDFVDVCGFLPAQIQPLTPGIYTDTLNATISF